MQCPGLTSRHHGRRHCHLPAVALCPAHDNFWFCIVYADFCRTNQRLSFSPRSTFSSLQQNKLESGPSDCFARVQQAETLPTPHYLQPGKRTRKHASPTEKRCITHLISGRKAARRAPLPPPPSVVLLLLLPSFLPTPPISSPLLLQRVLLCKRPLQQQQPSFSCRSCCSCSSPPAAAAANSCERTVQVVHS